MLAAMPGRQLPHPGERRDMVVMVLAMTLAMLALSLTGLAGVTDPALAAIILALVI
jgi:hypothetical protein